MVQVANGMSPLNTPNGAIPCEGTRAFPFILDFTVTNAYLINFTQQFQQGQFTTIQTVWIDNKDNASDLEIVCSTTSQRIVAPAGSQGFYTLLCPSPPQFNVSSDGNLVMEIIFLNFYIPPYTYVTAPTSAGGLPQLDIPALDAIISGGLLQTSANPPTLGPLTNASGTITAGGTKQLVLAQNSARKRIILANSATAAEFLSFSFVAGNDVALIDLAAGEKWEENGSTIVGDALYLQAPTTGHAFTLYWA